jgi:hypothetical protein
MIERITDLGGPLGERVAGLVQLGEAQPLGLHLRLRRLGHRLDPLTGDRGGGAVGLDGQVPLAHQDGRAGIGGGHLRGVDVVLLGLVCVAADRAGLPVLGGADEAPWLDVHVGPFGRR